MTKPKCRLNDTCFIIKSVRQANLGKVVETVEYLGYFQKDEQFLWNGEFWSAVDTDYHWVIKGNSLMTMYGPSRLSTIMDSWLLPIKPETNDDEVIEVEDTPEENIV